MGFISGAARRFLVLAPLAFVGLSQASPSVAQMCSFAGTWRDHNGSILTVTQTGNSVNASYTYNGMPGSITGSVSQGTLSATYSVPAHADPQWRSGPTTLTISGDCNSWRGSYQNSLRTITNAASAVRVGAAPPAAAPAPVAPPAIGVQRVVLQGVISGQTYTANVQRTADGGWVWQEGPGTFRFRTVSQSATEIVLHDASRDMYHHFNLATRQTFWRQGANAPWNPHYTIVSMQ